MRRVWVVCALCWAGAAAAQEAEAPKPEAVHEVPAKKTSTTKATSSKAPAKSASKAATQTKTKPTASKSATSARSVPKAKTKATTSKSTSSAAPPPPSAAAPVAAVPVAPAPPPSAASSSHVTIPTTPHFHVDVPAGLQAWLDADDRMRPWLGKAVAAVDSCYADVRRDNASAAGVITFAVTMHQNARPSAAVGSLPASLRSLVPCVTTSLWSVRMPLFTGDEGARYDVAAHFDP